jgi:hypothetical protein
MRPCKSGKPNTQKKFPKFEAQDCSKTFLVGPFPFPPFSSNFPKNYSSNFSKNSSRPNFPLPSNFFFIQIFLSRDPRRPFPKNYLLLVNIIFGRQENKFP